MAPDSTGPSPFTWSRCVALELFPPVKLAVQVISVSSSVPSGRKLRTDSNSQEPMPLSLWIVMTWLSAWGRLQVKRGQWAGQVWVTEQEMMYGSPSTAFLLRGLSLGSGGSAAKSREGQRVRRPPHRLTHGDHHPFITPSSLIHTPPAESSPQGDGQQRSGGGVSSGTPPPHSARRSRGSNQQPSGDQPPLRDASP